MEASQSFSEALLNVYNCKDDKNCDQPWQRAKSYLQKNSSTPVRMAGENIVLTGSPEEIDDISITISRIFDQKTNQTLIFMDLQCKETSQGAALCNEGEKALRIKQGFQAALSQPSKSAEPAASPNQ